MQSKNVQKLTVKYVFITEKGITSFTTDLFLCIEITLKGINST